MTGFAVCPGPVSATERCSVRSGPLSNVGAVQWDKRQKKHSIVGAILWDKRQESISTLHQTVEWAFLLNLIV